MNILMYMFAGALHVQEYGLLSSLYVGSLLRGSSVSITKIESLYFDLPKTTASLTQLCKKFQEVD